MNDPERIELGGMAQNQTDVHDLVENPEANRFFHEVFSIVSFGSLRLAKSPAQTRGLRGFLRRLFYGLKSEDPEPQFCSTGKWQLLEIHASKYLGFFAGLAFAGGLQKTAAVLAGLGSGFAAVGNILDSEKLYLKKKANEELAVKRGLKAKASEHFPKIAGSCRFARGLAWGCVSAALFAQAF